MEKVMDEFNEGVVLGVILEEPEYCSNCKPSKGVTADELIEALQSLPPDVRAEKVYIGPSWAYGTLLHHRILEVCEGVNGNVCIHLECTGIMESYL